MKVTDTKTATAIARDEDNVTLRKDFIRCWLHAHPEVGEEEAHLLYDEMERRFPNMTRGGHRGMKGRLKPWQTIVHECPRCGKKSQGVETIKAEFGLRWVTYNTKKEGKKKKLYFQSRCPKCKHKKGGTGKRVNPEVQKFYTNQSDAVQ